MTSRITFVALQPSLQPQDRGQVQVVCRLVQQQELGAAHQRPGKVQAHAPAPENSLTALSYSDGANPSPCNRRDAPGFRRIAVDRLIRSYRPGRSAAEWLASPADIACCSFAARGRHPAHSRQPGRRRAALLGNVGDFVAGIECPASPSSASSSPWIRANSDDFPQPFAPDYAHSLPGVQLETGILEQDFASSRRAMLFRASMTGAIIGELRHA